MRVQRQRARHAAGQGAVEYEVERAKLRQHVAFDLAANEFSEMRAHAFCRDVLLKQGKFFRTFRTERDDGDA